MTINRQRNNYFSSQHCHWQLGRLLLRETVKITAAKVCVIISMAKLNNNKSAAQIKSKLSTVDKWNLCTQEKSFMGIAPQTWCMKLDNPKDSTIKKLERLDFDSNQPYKTNIWNYWLESMNWGVLGPRFIFIEPKSTMARKKRLIVP